MGKLGQLLVARGWITVQQLTRALQTQNSVGGRLGTCLLEMEVLGEDLIVRSLSEQLGVPAAFIEDLRAIPDEVLQLIPERLARRCRAIPFRVAGGRLDLAMQDPRNLVCQDEIAFACGRRVKVHVLHELRIYEALQRYYREECPSRYTLLLDRLNRARYLWAAKEGGAQPAPGEVPQGLQGMPRMPPGAAPPNRAAAAAAAEERTEVLSALTPEGLQGGARAEPGPPPSPRRRSLFRSRAAGGSPAPPVAGSGAERQLPPLEELDLRPEQKPQHAAGMSPAPAGATRQAAGREPEAARGAQVPPRSGAGAPGARLPPAAPGPGAGTRAPDLEATLALGPPGAARPLAPAAAGTARDAAAASRLQPAAAPPPAKIALTEAERAELGLDEPPPAAAAEEVEAAEPALAAGGAPVREAPANLAEVEQAFAATTDSEEVGRILLGYLARSFRRVALFQASRSRVTAWMAQGDGIDQEAFGRYTVSFKEPSVFLNLRQGSSIHMGPLPPMATHRELALCWGGGLPRDCVLLPVWLRDRLVAIIYADGGSGGFGGIDLEQMHRLVAATREAFGRCILSKKRGNAQS
jgi:hypothetical protein